MLIELIGHHGYMINESGIIVNLYGKAIKTTSDEFGQLYANIDGKNLFIKNLVAENFLNKQPNQHVIHLDKDSFNNHVTNLALSDTKEDDTILNERINKNKSSNRSQFIYQVYNDNECIDCIGRLSVANLIQYEEISLKNMVGNDRIIAFGPYKGYKIRRTNEKVYMGD